jgi:TRAP-type C4-dicarboxylate transport system permease small subunit
MPELLRAARRFGDVIEQIATSVALCAIIVLIFVAVVLRYFFSSGIIWGEEISRVLFIGMTYLAISRVDARGIHFRVSALHDYLPNARPYLDLMVNSVQLLVLGYLTYLTSALVLFVKGMGQRLPAADLPSYYFYVPIAVGLALGVLRSLGKLGASVAAILRRGP